MVIISVKNAEGDGFLYETTTKTLNDDLISSLVTIHNLRLRSRVVADSVRGLARYGPMKPPNGGTSTGAGSYRGTNGIDDGDGVTIEEITYDDNVVATTSYKNNNNNTATIPSNNSESDPSGLRIGKGPEPQLVATLERTVKDLEDYVDKSQVQKRVALTTEALMDKLATVRGAVTMAYPMGLPEWDTVKIALESSSVEDLKQTNIANDVFDPQSTTLWVAGKEFQRGRRVSDRLGSNEKTKVIAKLAKRGNGPPSREPVVNEEERKAMMAHYFKRQEELKRLAEAGDDDDDYLNSRWADPKEMKKCLQGLETIKAPGLRF